jgi:hypothetical protein
MIECRCDKLSLQKNVGVIICQRDQMSVINCRIVICRGPVSQNLSLTLPSNLSFVPVKK